MYISTEDINELKQKIDFLTLLKRYTYISQFNDNLYVGFNPFDKTDKSFVYNIDEKTYFSLKEGVGGDVFTFIMRLKNLSFVEAYYYLQKETYQNVNKSNHDQILIFKQNAIAEKLYQSQMTDKIVIDYCKKRKFSDQTIRNFKIGYANSEYKNLYKELRKEYSVNEIKKSGLVSFMDNNYIKDKFRNRIIFPILNESGFVIGFGGRILVDKKTEFTGPKYLNSSESIIFDKSSNLYGLHISKDSKKDYFICCEGYVDTISLHQYGFDNGIAGLGTALTENHARLIKKYKNKVYLAYDSDLPGVNATVRAMEIMKKHGIKVKIIDMNPCKDPDEFLTTFGKESFEKRIQNALSEEEWKLKQIYLGNLNI